MIIYDVIQNSLYRTGELVDAYALAVDTKTVNHPSATGVVRPSSWKRVKNVYLHTVETRDSVNSVLQLCHPLSRCSSRQRIDDGTGGAYPMPDTASQRATSN